MSKFKAGDKIIRTSGRFGTVNKGGIYTVSEVYSTTRMKLKECTSYYDPEYFELYEEKNVKEFTKDMLTTGMRVMHRNGEVGIVLKDIGVLSYRNNGFNYLDDYGFTLSYLDRDWDDTGEWDIVKVYEGFTQDSRVIDHKELGELLWERVKETPQQKQIAALQQTIKKAQAQLDELQKLS